MELESTEKPYINFYDEHKISPVSQDISDITKHFDRRSSLYRHLGIVPSFISGKSIIEFCPGNGHNAIYTNSLRPARYVLVDANPTGLYHTKELLTQYATSSTLNFEIVDSLIEDYKDEKSYDLVICECVIPRQNNPLEFLKRISQFVTTGGVLIISCVDSISWLSESLRRIFAYLIMDNIGNSDSLAKKLDILRPFFEIQLKSLIHMSRTMDDWIMDNIINPLNGNLLPIPDAIKTLKHEFDIYGSSPNFFTDWRWYKGLYGKDKSFNESAIDMYYSNAHNLLDYRYVFPQRPIEKGASRLTPRSCTLIFSLIQICYGCLVLLHSMY